MNPNHPAAKKLRNRVDRNGSVADESGDDAESMEAFAARERQALLPQIKKADARVKKHRKSVSRG
jgi:hypothetical protein